MSAKRTSKWREDEQACLLRSIGMQEVWRSLTSSGTRNGKLACLSSVVPMSAKQTRKICFQIKPVVSCSYACRRWLGAKKQKPPRLLQAGYKRVYLWSGIITHYIE